LISNAEPQQIVDNVAAIVQKYFIKDCGEFKSRLASASMILDIELE